MERNSDLVKMASYAPLFENRNDRTWPVNLIWIDNMQVVGRSSYYVQKVMAENKPTYNLKTVIIPRAVSTSEPKAGNSLADSVAAVLPSPDMMRRRGNHCKGGKC